MGAAHQEDWNQLLARLIEVHATPIIKSVIRRKLTLSGRDGQDIPAQDEEDVHGEVVVQLVARLSALKLDRERQMIADFRGYVAVVAFNACHYYLRRKYPQRWRLKNRVRYVLTHHAPFALWESPGEVWLCGLAAWRVSGESPLGASRLQSLRDDSSKLSRVDLKGADARHVALPDLLAAIFDWSQAPLEMDALVNTVAALQGVTDQPLLAGDDEGREGGSLNQRLPDKRSDLGTEVERHSYLVRVWEELLQLPLPQRVALLLNLRDSQEGVLALLPISGVATIRQIAEAVAIPAVEFAGLWNGLPLDDAAIATRLGVTRQQIINLRKAARARLGRRMRLLEGSV